MRKQTKLVAVLSAAALLAIGASMTSFAAQGWQEENGSWYYYDNNGDAVESEWKKSGNNWFWLGEDGAMVTDALVEDGNNHYYVNANGAMVTNSWVAVEPGEDDYEDNAPDHYWYYFGANGRAYKASNGLVKKTINGKTYAFDENGKMLYGFVDEQGNKLEDEEPFKEAVYYFGSSDDGAMLKGWLEYTDGSDETDYENLDVMWFYFGSNGKKVAATTSEYKEKVVNGQKYAFDEYGVMSSEFTDTSLASGATATKSDSYKYFSDQYDGHLKKNTWVYAIPDEEYSATYGIEDYDNGTSRWFYANASGKLIRDQKKKINGKYYVFDEAGAELDTETVNGNKYGFDENGVMVYEWNETSTLSTATGSGIKYFSEETDGHLQKKTWIYAVPSEEIDPDDYNDDQYRWFYTDSQGNTYKSDLRKINGKKYLFNEVGIMQSGLQWVDASDLDNVEIDTSDDITDTSEHIMEYNTDGYNLYYFSGDEEADGSMKTGKNIKIELDDDTFTFAFKNNGQAYDYSVDGLEDKKVYINGILQKADSDMRYEKVSVENKDGETVDYLVGTSGTVVSNKKYVKDGDDNWWSVDPNGKVEDHGSEDESKDIARCVSQGKDYDSEIEDDGDVKITCK